MPKGQNVTSAQILNLIKHQQYTCAISGRVLTPETASLDHIVPLGKGGQHALANVWVVDHQVNTAKGTMTLQDFIAMCRDVVAYQDRVQNLHGSGKSA